MHIDSKFKKIIVITVIAVIVILVIYGLFFRFGTLKLTTTPSDSIVKIDGVTTSQRKIKVKPGNHILSISKDGYIEKEQTISIDRGKTLDLNITLSKNSSDNIAINVVKSTIYKDYPNYEFKPIDSTFIDDGEWLVAKLAGEEDDTIVILKRESPDNYNVYLAGPPFNMDVVDSLPEAVKSITLRYLKDIQ